MVEKLMKQKVKKTTKKSFFEVATPLTSAKIQLYASAKEDLENKTIKLDLTKTLRGKSLELKMRIKINEGSLEAHPEEITLVTAHIGRIIRNSTDYCEDSFQAETRDYMTRVKPFLLTRKRVSRTVLNLLRENTKKFLLTYLKTRTANEIFQEIITNKLQKQLSQKLKKIYPLAACEIRVFRIEKELDKKGTNEFSKKVKKKEIKIDEVESEENEETEEQKEEAKENEEE